ncbi:MAG: hypothetical protein IE889_02790 [Campylobacterales bacterium]|nr:hypothetical protein [Campylobacterales bacterium]
MHSILDRLDKAFKDKSENEKWMIIMMIVLVIGYMTYALFLPYAEERFNQSEQKKTTLQNSIRKHEQYIQSITVGGDRDFFVKKYDDDILSLKKRIARANEDITFITTKLDELSPLLFNKESWSKFLNSITNEAKSQAVKIQYIDNEYVDNNGSFGHVLEIAIGCEGEYSNIVKFVNQLEKNVLVTDIYGSDVRLDQNDTTTFADINISVWGINH